MINSCQNETVAIDSSDSDSESPVKPMLTSLSNLPSKGELGQTSKLIDLDKYKLFKQEIENIKQRMRSGVMARLGKTENLDNIAMKCALTESLRSDAEIVAMPAVSIKNEYVTAFPLQNN